MAQGKSSPSGNSGSGSSNRPARPSGSSKAGTTKPNTTRPAGRGPAQRPPARRKKKSIVNQKQRSWGLIIASVVIVVFAAVIVVVVIATHKSSSGPQAQIIPSTPTGAVTKQAKVTREPNKSGIKGVIAYDTEGWPGNGDAHPGALQHQHVTGPVDYSLNPPAGGPHNATWMNAGVYTKPIPSERAVHNLEHGAVWITYRPNLSKSDVSTLMAFVGKQSLISEATATGIAGQQSRYMDMSPWTSKTLPAPIVISAWGYQLYLKSPSDSRMQAFVDKFRHNATYSPEFGSAVDGIPVKTGGRAAYYGATKSNPAGTASS